MLVLHKLFLQLDLQQLLLLVLALKLVTVQLTGIVFHGLIQVPQALLEAQVLRVPLEQQAPLDLQVVHRLLVRLDLRVQRELLVLVEQAPQALQVPHQRLLVLKVPLDLLDPQVTLDLLVGLVLKEQQQPLVPQDLRVLQVQQVRLVLLAQLVLKVQQAQQGRLVIQAQLVM